MAELLLGLADVLAVCLVGRCLRSRVSELEVVSPRCKRRRAPNRNGSTARTCLAAGLQILPVSEIAAKDEFFNIKNRTRDGVLAAHSVPPQLLGTMSNNMGGFGDVMKAVALFGCNEIGPLQAEFLFLKEWAGQEVVRVRSRLIVNSSLTMVTTMASLGRNEAVHHHLVAFDDIRTAHAPAGHAE